MIKSIKMETNELVSMKSKATSAISAFFALGLLCILYVTMFEALRLNGKTTHAARVEIITRGVFLASVAAMIGAAALLA